MATRANGEQGLEQRPWDMADALRGSMDASENTYVVLGLTFLEYVSDAFARPAAAKLYDMSSNEGCEHGSRVHAQAERSR